MTALEPGQHDPAARTSTAERVLPKITMGPECWLWEAWHDHDGYGLAWMEGKFQKAHRVVYELLVGPIPPGLDLDHVCGVRRCVRPSHLDPVTHRENLLRGQTIPAKNAAKTRCPRGHAYTEANTYITKKGSRVCRMCRRVGRREQK